MSDQNVVNVLLRKRAEMSAQIQGVQSAIFQIDQTLALIGYTDGRLRADRRFANGELIALIGEGDRPGHTSTGALVQYVMPAKGLDAADARLKAKIVHLVKECRNRMNARGT
jgi:hypothetical protein